MIHPVRYRRRPPEIEAVEVTADNLPEVAAWCGGTVLPDAVGVRLGRSIIPARPGMHIARETYEAADYWPIKADALHRCYELVT